MIKVTGTAKINIMEYFKDKEPTPIRIFMSNG